MMLTTSDFVTSTIADTKPLSLVRGLDGPDRDLLIAGTAEAPIAIILEGEFAHQHFKASGSEHWDGLIIPNLRVEVDDTSAFDARAIRNPVGSVVRTASELALLVQNKPPMGLGRICLETGLADMGQHSVGFYRWQLVRGEGQGKQVFRIFDVSPHE